MNKVAVAKELIQVAKLLQAIEFDTQDAFDKYMKEHPEADKSNHSVKKEEKTEKPEESMKDKIKQNIQEKDTRDVWDNSPMHKHFMSKQKEVFDTVNKSLKIKKTNIRGREDSITADYELEDKKFHAVTVTVDKNPMGGISVSVGIYPRKQQMASESAQGKQEDMVKLVGKAFRAVKKVVTDKNWK
jgi:hypothetical protein